MRRLVFDLLVDVHTKSNLLSQLGEGFWDVRVESLIVERKTSRVCFEEHKCA